MKLIIITPDWGLQDCKKYGDVLLNKLTSDYHASVYETIADDFSNIPELFDEEEKIILFSQFVHDTGFELLTKNVSLFKGLKYILSPYSSYEGLDVELLKKLGIKYRNNAGANAPSIAQYAITAMFMLLSRFPELSVFKSLPDGSILGEEYGGKTAGIVGMGRVGEEILNNLNKLGIPVEYYNRSEKNMNATQVDLESLFKNDVIFISIATNDDTKLLLQSISQLIQPHNYLIDISAADDLYDKNAVVEMLNENKLRGYALEVFDPTTFNATSSKNYIATPHIAWCTVDAERRTVQNYLQRALFILEGKQDTIDFVV